MSVQNVSENLFLNLVTRTRWLKANLVYYLVNSEPFRKHFKYPTTQSGSWCVLIIANNYQLIKLAGIFILGKTGLQLH